MIAIKIPTHVLSEECGQCDEYIRLGLNLSSALLQAYKSSCIEVQTDVCSYALLVFELYIEWII